MNEKYLIICLILLSFLWSCKDKTSIDQARTYDIDVACKLVYPFSEFITIEKVIPLESNSQSLLVNIGRLRIVNDRIFIQSRNDIVKVFSLEGEYLYCIGKKGKGPGELILPLDFDFSPGGDNVAIWDRDGFKLNIYNLDGSFLKSIPSLHVRWGFRFSWLEEKRFLLSSLYRRQDKTGECYQFYLLDEHLEVIQGMVPYNSQLEGWGILGPTFVRDGEGGISYRHPFGGEVYGITDEAKMKYRLFFGKNHLPVSRFKEYLNQPQLMRQDYVEKDYVFTSNLLEVKGYVYCRYGIANKGYSLLIDKSSGKHVRYRHDNPFDFLSSIAVVGSYNGSFVGRIQPYLVKEKLGKLTNQERTKYKDEIKFWEQLLKDKSDSDNPILVFLKPKDF